MTATPSRACSRSLPAVLCLVSGAQVILFSSTLLAEEPTPPTAKPGQTFTWTPEGPVNTSVTHVPDESKAYKSLDVKSLSPLADQLGRLGIFSGVYDFNEGVEDKVVGVKKRNEVSYANQTYIQSEYHTHPDLKRENAFVGLWASFPLRAPGESRAENLERLRTRREALTDPTPAPPSPAPAVAGSAPIVEVSSVSKPLFQIAHLFKAKPKANLIPTSASPVAAPSGEKGSTPGNASTHPDAAPVAVPPPSVEKRSPNWAEQIFGKLPRRTSNRASFGFHR